MPIQYLQLVKDVREASLLKANAYTDYNNGREIEIRAEQSKSNYNLAYLFFMALIVGLFAFSCSTLRSCMNPAVSTVQGFEHSYVAPTQVAPTQAENEFQSTVLQMFMHTNEANRPIRTLEEELTWFRDNPNRLDNIPRILAVMRRHGVWDVNGDGVIDCIDHSLIFRKLYGSNARIIINVNPNNGMNHMFIRVLWDGGLQVMDIEPQGTPERFSMGVVWGVMYNPMFNRDVTSQWTHVVGGMSGR